MLLFGLKGRSQATLQFNKSPVRSVAQSEKWICVGGSLVCLHKSFQVVHMDLKKKGKKSAMPLPL